MNVVEVRGLSKKFRSGFFLQPVPVLHNVHFHVQKAVVTGFIGANGSGKTTILKSLLGFIRPDAGEILFFDQMKLCNEVKGRIGFLPERPYFYDFLTGFDFLRLHLRLSRGSLVRSEWKQRIEQVLARVGLQEVAGRKLRYYSKGMLQRIGIAQALLHQPEFLILDEPMSGLDPDGRIEVKQIIKELAEQGTTIFFSSHLLHDAEELCQNLVILKKGKVIFCGDASVIKGQAENLEAVYQGLAQGKK